MMTKHLFLFFIIIFIAMTAGTWLIHDPGYILIIFHHWQIETSIVFFLIALVLTGLVLTFGFKILHTIISIPSFIHGAWQYLRQLRLQKQEHRGLQAYFAEQWPLALKQLKPTHQMHSWTIDLLAANAAQQQGQLKERDRLISQALIQEPKAKESIILFQAKLQIEKKQYEQAQASLEQIPLQSRYHSPLWLILQTTLDIHFKQFKKGLERLINYRKLLEPQSQYLDLYRICLLAEIQLALTEHKVIFAFELYKSAPLILQLHPELLKLLMPHLDTHPKLLKSVYKYLKKHLKFSISNELLFAISDFPNPNLWLDLLESFSPKVSQQAAYYYALGKLHARQKIWGVALSELQQSIALEESIPAYTELAQIYLELQQTSHALQAMQKALELKL